MPGPLTSGLAALAGSVAALSQRERRLMIGRHLRRVHGPGLRGVALERRIHQAFDSYSRYWAESFRLPTMTAAEMDAEMSVQGIWHIEEALAAGRGAIMAIPHLGGWDFGGAWLASVGYPPTAVVEELQPPELFEWFTKLRSSVGVDVVPLGRAAGTAVMRALRSNRLVALVCDRGLASGNVDVEFFGERTVLPAGPATLALRTGAALLPTAIYFDGPRSHLGVVRPPLTVERTGSLRDDVGRVTQAVTYELEKMIRRAPEQWHLFQPNWPSDYELLGRPMPGAGGAP